MFTITANSVRDNEPRPVPGKFLTPGLAQTHVERELRGVSSYWQVWILNSDGERVVRGYRSGPGGTGEHWTWKNLDGNNQDR